MFAVDRGRLIEQRSSVMRLSECLLTTNCVVRRSAVPTTEMKNEVEVSGSSGKLDRVDHESVG